MPSQKVALVKKELIELNEKFYKKLLLTEKFYMQLMQNGFAYRQCLLISVFPDSSNTYCGKLIRQDGAVFEFDIDLDSTDYSSWNDVTCSFREFYEINRTKNPWLKEVVSYDLFHELKNPFPSAR